MYKVLKRINDTNLPWKSVLPFVFLMLFCKFFSAMSLTNYEKKNTFKNSIKKSLYRYNSTLHRKQCNVDIDIISS